MPREGREKNISYNTLICTEADQYNQKPNFNVETSLILRFLIIGLVFL